MTPVIILIRPQMGENIGAAARVMRNFGMEELRIVAPRDGWPNPKADAMARGGLSIVENAKLYNTTAEAVADLQYLCAATVRPREMLKPVVTPRQAAHEMLSRPVERCGVLFGPERTGLENEDIVIADHILTIPVDAAYGSLNLAQSVAILCYEWYVSERQPVDISMPTGVTKPATKEELHGLFEHLAGSLDKANFFKVPEKREKMLHNINNIFLRIGLNNQDVRTFRGIITSLTKEYD